MINELKLDELKNLFFYTFGIVPLQYYNVVGDGMTDNRLNLQQAIYDAIAVGANYIFVPKGNYFYSNSLFKANEVTFVGNSLDSFIRDVEIQQFPEFNNTVPIGGVIMYAGKSQTIPSKFVQCAGQTLRTENYCKLYETITENVPEDKEDYPETFTIPTLTTGDSSTQYIMRAR